jgi:hypothetical protein
LLEIERCSAYLFLYRRIYEKTYKRRSGKRNVLFREMQFAKVAVVDELNININSYSANVENKVS